MSRSTELIMVLGLFVKSNEKNMQTSTRAGPYGSSLQSKLIGRDSPLAECGEGEC